MNNGQNQFRDFILERAKKDKVEEARVLLDDSFVKQAEGRITPHYMNNLLPNMIALIEPDKVEEVRKVMEDYSNNLSHIF